MPPNSSLALAHKGSQFFSLQTCPQMSWRLEDSERARHSAHGDLLGLLGAVWGMAGTDYAEEVAEARRGQGLLNASVQSR